MATALLLPAIITAVVLALIARPLFDKHPAAEVVPDSYLLAAQNQVAKMSGPICPYDDTDNNHFRAVQFLLGPGADIQGLPARGGLFMLIEATGVELDFLGLDRFRDTPRPAGVGAGSSDEEAHCDRMRQLGASWWPGSLEYVKWRIGDNGGSPYVKVGWPPGGGVWVLSTTYDEASEKGAAIIHNAYSMDERCKALEQLGAVFYEDPRDCPDLDLPCSV